MTQWPLVIVFTLCLIQRYAQPQEKGQSYAQTMPLHTLYDLRNPMEPHPKLQHSEAKYMKVFLRYIDVWYKPDLLDSEATRQGNQSLYFQKKSGKSILWVWHFVGYSFIYLVGLCIRWSLGMSSTAVARQMLEPVTAMTIKITLRTRPDISDSFDKNHSITDHQFLSSALKTSWTSDHF